MCYLSVLFAYWNHLLIKYLSQLESFVKLNVVCYERTKGGKHIVCEENRLNKVYAV